MVLRASLTLMDAQSNTNVKDLLGRGLLRKFEFLLKTDAQKSTTPRETAGSRSPRRVDNIDGQRVEGLSWIKLMVNELKAADAERQTKDAWCGTVTKLRWLRWL